MLILLQARARDLGGDLRFEAEFRTAENYRKEYDLVVAADGINSLVRREYADAFQPDIDSRKCKFVWRGTHQKFDDGFIFEKTDHGLIWAHVYQFDDNTATFIVETLPETWDRLGFAAMTKEETVATCARIFARHLGGHDLMSNAAHLRGAAVWMQIGHAGRKALTCVPWDGGGIDAPLATGNWPLISASAIPYMPASQTPKAMGTADFDAVTAQFVAATRMAGRAGADMIELHAAHGYLPATFLSPVTNNRTDAYGGSLDNRLRYPLGVFRAMRAVWPDQKPMSVRISAHDGIDGGVTPDEAVTIARAFRAAGADIIDLSAGQTDPAEKPVYGRMFQTPFGDRIRNEAGIPTMTVGNISDGDKVNGILMAGRADLVCLARMHLADPYWTLHAAAAQGDTDTEWPVPYAGRKALLFRLAERQQEAIRA